MSVKHKSLKVSQLLKQSLDYRRSLALTDNNNNNNGTHNNSEDSNADAALRLSTSSAPVSPPRQSLVRTTSGPTSPQPLRQSQTIGTQAPRPSFAVDMHQRQLTRDNLLSVPHQPQSLNMDEFVDEVVEDNSVVVYRVSGVLTYVNAIAHAENLRKITQRPKCTVVLDLRYLYYVDMDGLTALKDIVATLDKHKVTTFLCGANEFLLPKLTTLDWFRKKVDEGFVFQNYSKAVEVTSTL